MAIPGLATVQGFWYKDQNNNNYKSAMIELPITGSNLSEQDQLPRQPDIDMESLLRFRLQRTREQLARNKIPFCLLSNPVSLRYVAGIRQFSIFQARTPFMCLLVPAEGPLILYGGFNIDRESTHGVIEEFRPAQALSVFMGGLDLTEPMRIFREDIESLMSEYRFPEPRIAIENMSPLVTRSLVDLGFEVTDAQVVLEQAHKIKSSEEVECMKWAVRVTEYAISNMHSILRPGVRENELWAALNYTNIANDREWADSRQIASGPRTNPFLAEASERQVQDGDLVCFDTDMIGPFGYCADISRTFHCGPSRPTKLQRDLYQRAYHQLQHNMNILEVGVSYDEIIEKAYRPDTGYHQFPLIMHGLGMADDFLPGAR